LVSVAALAAWAGHAAAQAPESAPKLAPAEVRGTWVTPTAHTAIASPANTAETMTKLRAIGLNTVYVETWKNGYTQYPSEALKKVIGVDRRPNLMPQDPSDTPEQLKKPARDLLDETLIEAHRNQLIYIGWFEFGFMAAHSSTQNHLRKMKPEWMSRDIKGNEV
ncbi:MAG: family 10 glycosylhydrolase, partial [Phycisphaerae bacterium]